MKKINVILMLAFTALVCSLMGCSQEDDGYDNAEMYTLAEMGTRLGGKGDPGGMSPKTIICWKKRKEYIDTPTGALTPFNMSSPASLPNSTDPILYGEYDTSTLTISISNFNGSADIYIYSVQGHDMMDVTSANVDNGTSIDFPLLDYTSGVDYEIYISLSNGEAYLGQFDL